MVNGQVAENKWTINIEKRTSDFYINIKIILKSWFGISMEVYWTALREQKVSN